MFIHLDYILFFSQLLPGSPHLPKPSFFSLSIKTHKSPPIYKKNIKHNESPPKHTYIHTTPLPPITTTTTWSAFVFVLARCSCVWDLPWRMGDRPTQWQYSKNEPDFPFPSKYQFKKTHGLGVLYVLCFVWFESLAGLVWHKDLCHSLSEELMCVIMPLLTRRPFP